MLPRQKQLKAQILRLYSIGEWDGRASAVILGKKFNVPSTLEVLRFAETTIEEFNKIQPDNSLD